MLRERTRNGLDARAHKQGSLTGFHRPGLLSQSSYELGTQKELLFLVSHAEDAQIRSEGTTNRYSCLMLYFCSPIIYGGKKNWLSMSVKQEENHLEFLNGQGISHGQ
jgi:hypothetical protein